MKGQTIFESDSQKQNQFLGNQGMNLEVTA